MGRARRARRVATRAAFGGGVGAAGVGVIGVLGYALLQIEARVARRVVGVHFDGAPQDSGRYEVPASTQSSPGAGWHRPRRAGGVGAQEPAPVRLVVLGDSSGAGMGVDLPSQTVGALIATRIADLAARPVELCNVAVIGAQSLDLDEQVREVAERVEQPDVALVMIGANDITHRLDRSIAVRHLSEAVRALRGAGAQVVVGTCPDLGAIEPIPQPLKLLTRRWSRDLAAAQTVAVIEAGGRTVSLGDLLGPEFAARPREMFSTDRFHPSPQGYARAASALLPSVLDALGLESVDTGREPDRRRGEGVGPIARVAVQAVRDPGTEVSAAPDRGGLFGRRVRWATFLRRHRPPAPQPDGAAGTPERAPVRSGTRTPSGHLPGAP